MRGRQGLCLRVAFGRRASKHRLASQGELVGDLPRERIVRRGGRGLPIEKQRPAMDGEDREEQDGDRAGFEAAGQGGEAAHARSTFEASM